MNTLIKNTNSFCVKPLFLTVVFLLFGAFNLSAQAKTRTITDVDLGNLKDELRAEIKSKLEAAENSTSALKDEIDALNKTVTETKDAVAEISASVEKTSIWQIVSALAAVLAAVSLAGIVFLLLLHLRQTRTAAKGSQESSGKKTTGTAAPAVLPSEFYSQKDKLEEAQSKLEHLANKTEQQTSEIRRFQTDLDSIKNEMNDFSQKIQSANNEVSLLKTGMEKDRKELAWKEKVTDTPVAAFNEWAQNPQQTLPRHFKFVTIAKPEFKNTIDIFDSGMETDWIQNTLGEKIFIFPNPKKIDNMGGSVDKLYKVTGPRKGIGTNTVKITNACQLIDGNYIEFQGELLLN